MFTTGYNTGKASLLFEKCYLTNVGKTFDNKMQ